MSPLLPKAGEKWQHFKGGVYEVIDVARIEGSNPVHYFVVYRAPDRTMWARPLEEWQDPSGPRREPRFRKVIQ